MRIDILQLPTMLPTTLDPQVRNYFTSFTANLQFFADQVTQVVNELEVVVGLGGRAADGLPTTAIDQMQHDIAELLHTVQQLADRVTKLEAP